MYPIGIDGAIFGWTAGARETAAMLNSFTELGGNLVSTADHYSGGRSQVMIGAWLKTLADRESAVIETTIGRHPDAQGLSARAVTRATELSLRRLDTDYIDVLTLDGEDPSVPIDDTLEAIDTLRRAGKVRHLAVTDHSAARIRAMNQRAADAVYPPVRAVVLEYNLAQRRFFENEFPHPADEPGVGFIVKYPWGNRQLGEPALGTPRLPQPKPRPHLPVHLYGPRRSARIIETLTSVARELGAPRGQLAIAWALSKPGVSAVLLDERGDDSLADAFGAVTLTLGRHHLAALDRASL